MVNVDCEEEVVKNDLIILYEMVKYFNVEQYEFVWYCNVIVNFQMVEVKVIWGINYMNMCQLIVFMCGLLVVFLICGYEVFQGICIVGEFMFLVIYFVQL